MQFSDLDLRPELLEAVAAKGYKTPSPIQAKAIPAVLSGRDIMGAAQTGTGKTAGFTLPMLQRLADGKPAASNLVRALVLTPTRELAAQVQESVTTYGQHLPLRSAVVYGGVSINPQMQALRRGADILVATPGRLLDLYSQNAVKFSQLEILVLDEADRMLDMGFIHDIRKIIQLLPKQRQNLLFSATFSDEIRALAKGLVHNPLEIDVAPRNTTVERVKQCIHPLDKAKKSAALIHLIKTNNWFQVLVFSRTKHGANKLVKQLDSADIQAVAIHGNKSQGARTKALADFKANKVQVMVATDIAARGIDIDQLPHVINFDLPNVPEDYVHRIGRTGRAGAEGEAISLVSADEAKQLFDIERLIGKNIPREYLEDFYPAHEVPASRTVSGPAKPKKPKKPKPPANSATQETPRSRHKNSRSDGAGNRSGKDRHGQNPAGKKSGSPSKWRNRNSKNTQKSRDRQG